MAHKHYSLIYYYLFFPSVKKSLGRLNGQIMGGELWGAVRRGKDSRENKKRTPTYLSESPFKVGYIERAYSTVTFTESSKIAPSGFKIPSIG